MRVFNPAVRIRASQIGSLGSVLTQAFDKDPVVEYILPDARTRPSVLSWFFNSVAIPTSRLCGEIYTTTDVDGGALWIRPGVDLTIRDAVKTQLPSLSSDWIGRPSHGGLTLNDISSRSAGAWPTSCTGTCWLSGRSGLTQRKSSPEH
jgi:hypothetical protein